MCIKTRESAAGITTDTTLTRQTSPLDSTPLQLSFQASDEAVAGL